MAEKKRPRSTISATIAGLLFILAMSACGESAEPAQAIRVVVSIPPLRGLVEPMMPEGTEVRVLVPAGRSIHGFEPSPEDIAKMARADVVIFIGLGLEGRLIDAARRDRPEQTLITMANVLSIKNAPSHHHQIGVAHGSTDPHLWLDPVLAARFVRTLPAHLPGQIAGKVGPAAETLARKIDAVDEAYRERLAPFAGRAIVTHHAAFNRVASRYGLRVSAVLRTVEAIEPSADDIASARKAIENEGIGAVFVEPQFNGTSAQRLAESTGVKLVVLDPLGDGDWFAMMRTNLDRLVEGLSAGGDTP